MPQRRRSVLVATAWRTLSAVCWKCGERDRQRHPSHESHQGNIYRRLGEEVPAIDHTPEHQEDEQDYESILLNEEEAIKR